jgi:DNA-binding IclR family transcriptional regulator
MPGTVQSIERAVAILRLLAASSGRMGVGEIARSLDLAKATAHGILRTLQHVGFVEQDTASGRYQLGAALLHLGTSYLDVNELRSRSINWADPLASRSGQAVRIGAVHEHRVLVVHHVFRPDDSFQTLDVGTLLPLHASALGKVLLAYNEAEATLILRNHQEVFTRRTIVDPGPLARAIGEVRDRGLGIEVEELTIGEAGVAAPIRGYGGLVVGAIGVSGPVERVCDSRGVPNGNLVSNLRDAARAISRDLGATRR